MCDAIINPEILLWACNRASLDSVALADKARIKHSKIEQWLNGLEKPTFNQAKSLAKALHIPFGYLFLDSPPKDIHTAIPDFRTISSGYIDKISTNLSDIIADILRKQDWFRDYIQKNTGDENPFIGRFNASASFIEVAKDITKHIGLDIDERNKIQSVDKFFDTLCERIERLGILVMKSGVVGNNTHRKLEVSEFRGIAFYDKFSPIIFINGNDARNAQVFTLAHELAHLWIGEGGISNISLEQNPNTYSRNNELLCNNIAAEVLVPEKYLRKEWKTENTIAENINKNSRTFRVSTTVIARRAYDLHLIRWEDYIKIYKSANLQTNTKKTSGGNAYNTIPVRNSKTFTHAVLRSAYSNELLLRDAGKLLGITPACAANLANSIGAK